MEAAPPRLRRLTLSLRVMMLLVLVVACWLGSISNKARRQRGAVEAIKQYGGYVQYDWEMSVVRPPTPPGPKWLRSLIGDDYFQEVIDAELVNRHAGNVLEKAVREDEEVVAHLADLRGLKVLGMRGNPVTNAGMGIIGGLTSLECLNLLDCPLPRDAIAAQLANLRNLRLLNIGDCKLTDAQLVRLKGLTKMSQLYLGGNLITDDGLVHLSNLKDLVILDIRNSSVTDRGLEHLTGLPRLKELYIGRTKITDDGIKKFQEAVPSLKRVVR
jgi:hypothetical protein